MAVPPPSSQSSPLFSLERGLLFVLSAPSGAGKTTIFNGLLKRFKDLTPSISATTRLPRLGEKPGEDYDFMLPEVFQSHEENGMFLESAVVYGHYYGTPRDRVAQNLVQGRDVLFDVDWQGAHAIKKNWHSPERVVTIYILPPSLAILKERLIKRGTDTPEVVAARMATARHEIGHMDFYDYVILNDTLGQAMENASLIIQAERALQSAGTFTPTRLGQGTSSGQISSVNMSPESVFPENIASERMSPDLAVLLSHVESLRAHAQEGLKEKLLGS